MANITIAGIDVDTEDVDLLVKYCPLAELDRLIQDDNEIMATLTDPKEISFWEHRAESHRLARDIAENMWNNGEIPTNQLHKMDWSAGFLQRRITELSDYAHMLEGNLTSLRETLKQHVNEKGAKRTQGKRCEGIEI